MDTNRRLALLVDGDNAQAALLPQMLAEVSKYGTLTIRRVYGDWTEPEMKSWKERLHTYALQPVQQFRYTKGKNATDSALIIDAMDILYTAGVDGFCIASSDSDYTRLATRIREKNMFVMGIGKALTPAAFVNACTVFVYTENLGAAAASTDTPETVPVPEPKPAASTGDEPKAKLSQFKTPFQKAFDLVVQEDGWAHLSALGSSLRQLDPGFDPRTYGYKQLSQLIRAGASFIEVKPPGSPVEFVRPKLTSKPKKKPSTAPGKKVV